MLAIVLRVLLVALPFTLSSDRAALKLSAACRAACGHTPADGCVYQDGRPVCVYGLEFR